MIARTELETWLAQTWKDYQSDEYNSYGKLNLVACIGEKGGLILKLINELRAENERLRRELSQHIADRMSDADA